MFMPITTHIVKVEKDNTIKIPKTICDALGISEGIPLRIKSDNNGYSVTVKTVPSMESIKLIDELKEEITRLQKENRDIKEKWQINR